MSSSHPVVQLARSRARRQRDTLDLIVAWESEGLDGPDTLELFSRLVKSGQAWTLQGSYGRAAQSLIDNGVLTADGEITDYGRDVAEEA